jgi:hypothetical protein
VPASAADSHSDARSAAAPSLAEVARLSGCAGEAVPAASCCDRAAAAAALSTRQLLNRSRKNVAGLSPWRTCSRRALYDKDMCATSDMVTSPALWTICCNKGRSTSSKLQVPLLLIQPTTRMHFTVCRQLGSAQHQQLHSCTRGGLDEAANTSSTNCWVYNTFTAPAGTNTRPQPRSASRAARSAGLWNVGSTGASDSTDAVTPAKACASCRLCGGSTALWFLITAQVACGLSTLGV